MLIRYNKAINSALKEEMQKDPTVFIAGEDVANAGGSFGITRGLLDEFGPERVIDTPISESAIVGMAVGASSTGLRPVIEIMFMDFIAVCFDPIINQAAKMRYMSGGQMTLPLVIRTQSGAGVNAGPQHSQSLEALLFHIPGIKVVMPSNPYDAKGLLKASIRDNNPVVFIENKALYGMKGEVPEEDYTIPLGEAKIVKEGKDVTIVALGQMVNKAMAAAQTLENNGISPEIIDPRTISPLDTETIKQSVKKTGRLIIVHEAVKIGGVGAEIAAMVQEEVFDYLDAPIQRVAAPFTPVPYSKPLENYYLPNENDIIQAVNKICVGRQFSIAGHS
ncbi:alpha-ketoacid dehydrogenase subunit beta [Neobacillus niacini]|uniref:alpha-ketoacid dehydrogenase subunit beta n=1 Tax=Neobacillus niacini TaxID=86668 RepID=UPI0007AC0232|nr:alpha-ketoacid dehydrogenase subunit beta [Neobacillus niacini]MEC1523881.1 alpha-ketoacid dehydrogenase subunit beta [Neobacillus niacini]